jgi:hypothetical protein
MTTKIINPILFNISRSLKLKPKPKNSTVKNTVNKNYPHRKHNIPPKKKLELLKNVIIDIPITDEIQKRLQNVLITEKCPNQINKEILLEHIVPEPLRDNVPYSKEQLWEAYYNVVYNKHTTSDNNYINSNNNKIHFNDFGLYLDKNTLQNDDKIYIFNPIENDTQIEKPECDPFKVNKNNIKFG